MRRPAVCCRVLPLNHMIKGTLRNLQLMMDDRLGARGMAAAAPGRQGGGKTASAAPPGVSVVVPRGAAMDGVALRGGSALGEH